MGKLKTCFFYLERQKQLLPDIYPYIYTYTSTFIYISHMARILAPGHSQTVFLLLSGTHYLSVQLLMFKEM